MTTNERLKMVMDAPREILERVDLVLCGRDVAPVDDELKNRTITAMEAAKRLGVSRPTVYRMVKDKELLTVTIRGIPRIWLPSVLAKVPSSTVLPSVAGA